MVILDPKLKPLYLWVSFLFSHSPNFLCFPLVSFCFLSCFCSTWATSIWLVAVIHFAVSVFHHPSRRKVNWTIYRSHSKGRPEAVLLSFIRVDSFKALQIRNRTEVLVFGDVCTIFACRERFWKWLSIAHSYRNLPRNDAVVCCLFHTLLDSTS